LQVVEKMFRRLGLVRDDGRVVCQLCTNTHEPITAIGCWQHTKMGAKTTELLTRLEGLVKAAKLV
jgi:hypothetical protein